MCFLIPGTLTNPRVKLQRDLKPLSPLNQENILKSPTTIVRRVVNQYSATSAALTSFDGIPNDANNRVKTKAKNYSFSSSEEFIIDAIFDSMVNRSCKPL